MAFWAMPSVHGGPGKPKGGTSNTNEKKYRVTHKKMMSD